MKLSVSERLINSTLIFALFLGFVLTLSKHAFAQDLDNVTISGRVVDQNGGVVLGATVEAILVKTGAARTVVTDGDGRYLIIQLEPGIYNLRVSATGFALQERTELTLISGQNLQLEITLLLRSVTVDPVTVVAGETPAVDTTRTVVGGTVTTHEIESLPIASRSVLDLIFTLPGVSEEALSTRDLAEDRNTNPSSTPEESGTFSLSGGPDSLNKITIDGMYNTDDGASR